jgi:predicted ATP-grasp superfamily ATP-dependent carboligase
MNTTAITAFVTGADHPTALGGARGVNAAGAEVIGFTARPEKRACLSRAWSEIRVLRSSDPSDRAMEVIRAASDSDGPIFLLPTEDDMVREFSRNREMLPDHVRLSLPSHECVELLLEKTRFAEWARHRDYPLPESEVVESRSQLDRVLGRFRFPAILKPLVRTPGWQEASPVNKAIRLTSATDLEKVTFDLFEVAPSYVLSEWIEGEDSDVYFCLVFLDDQSHVVASHTGRKLLQYPRLTGSTAICIDHPHPELEEMAAALFKDAGCKGLASLEVKRSSGDGRLLITEPTIGRPNLQSFSAVASGVNLYGIALRYVWNRDFSDLLSKRRRCVWVEEKGLFENVTSSRELPIPFGLIIREVLASRRLRWAYFRFRDLGPFLSLAWGWMTNAVRRLKTAGRRREIGG